MNKIIGAILFLILINFQIKSADYYAFVNGNYNNPGIWRIGSCNGPLAGSIPGITDNVYVCAGVNLNVPLNVTANNVYVYGTLSLDGNRTFTVSGSIYLFNGSRLTGNNINGTFNISNNLYIYDGCEINGTATFNINVNGNLYNEPTIAGYQSKIGRCDITVTGVTYINGYFIFTISAAGNKRFNGGIVISNTGTFDNTVGEDPFINDDIVNNGIWIGCTGGNCVYTLGNIAGRIIDISGANPITLSTII
ncbi:MAG: hypothetical protein N3A01_03400, partial [Bacteroidales bacterium]|nr:hypothetical protein [Bacteroidales bacterium]